MKKCFDERPRVCCPLLIMLLYELLSTCTCSINLFKHRTEGRSTWGNSPQCINYSLGLILKSVDFE